MRLAIVAVGRQKAGPLKELEQLYAGRILSPLTLIEVEEKRKPAPAELKMREAALLLDAVPKGAAIVALDRRGTVHSSEAFAQRLGAWRDAGTDLAFLIGGAEGLADSVLKEAKLVLSFGAMTWPHLLARAMLLEQIYRAQQILAGHPYHRG
jgi:23S rRNA (pseudouridine1915-N3)-methyltransferase